MGEASHILAHLIVVFLFFLFCSVLSKKMGEDCQMWLLVTHCDMIVSSMLLLAHTHARTHTLMPQDPFPTSHV